MQSVVVRHNIEMAHRLPNLPGKCQQIHGHSWWCELTISGKVTGHGVILDFHEVKAEFRTYLDSTYDHHLALSLDDPLLATFIVGEKFDVDDAKAYYPGLVMVDDDPTVENMARWIGKWAKTTFGAQYGIFVKLWEASTNAATWEG